MLALNDNIRYRLVGGLGAAGGVLVLMSIFYSFVGYSMGNLDLFYRSIIALVLVGVILLLAAITVHSKKIF